MSIISAAARIHKEQRAALLVERLKVGSRRPSFPPRQLQGQRVRCKELQAREGKTLLVLALACLGQFNVT